MIDKDLRPEKASPSALGFLEHRIPRDGHHLYLREYTGAGPAFVPLHGFPDNLHIYDRLIPILVGAGRRVVVFDFLGFGSSDKPAGYDYSFEQQLGDLAAVVDYLRLDKIVPIGHDAGGVAAINFAISNRERVSGLCLLNTFYANAPTLRMPELIGLFAIPELNALATAMAMDPGQMAFLLSFQQSQFKMNASQAQKDVIDEVLQPIINNNFAQRPSAGPAFAALAAKVIAQIQLNNEHLSQLESLTLPSTVIWGEGDAYLNTGVAKDFAARIKGASLHILDAGHWPQLDVPEAVAHYLLTDL
jgi:pimeloyl-ACP methyl ester carboxylesterase